MSDTTNTGNSNTNPAPRGVTVADAADAISVLLAREDGTPGKDPEPQAEAPAEGEQPEAPQPETPEEETQAEPGDQPGEAEPEGEEGDPEGEAEPEDIDPAKTFVTVKIDGKDEKLSVEEVTNGYLRLQDYTRKTQTLAEERRAFQQQAAAITAERQQYAELLPALKQQIEALLPQEPDWERLAVEDPMEFNRQFAIKQMRDHKLQAIQQEQARLSAMEQQRVAGERAKLLTEGRKWLSGYNASWSDDAKFNADQARLRGFLRGLGYSEQQIDAVDDPRAVALAWEAMLYRESVAKKPSSPARPAAAPPAQPQQQARPPAPAPAATRPGPAATGRTVSELTRTKQRLAKTGSVRDAAAAIELMMR